MPTTSEKSIAIRNEALRLGFSACGFAKAEFLPEDTERLKQWLEKGYNGSMQYMENHFEKRTDPLKLVEGARSVISLLLNYYTVEKQEDPDAPVISKYAYGTDYHFVMKDKMKSLFGFIGEHFGPLQGRVFVDSAPVLDRAWAYRAGLGWIGKNSNLINRELGSFVFIGEIISNLELDYNKIPESDFCGACSICIDSCPTDAIVGNRTIDSNRCISYQTIENRKEIPEHFRDQFQNRVFGCDICQDVCPWNKKAQLHNVRELLPNPDLLKMNRQEWKDLDNERFISLFKNSAVKRAGYKGLKRNIDFLES
ncbi:MAG: tRNA epoxyqueuosine(34) reductase QueG [Bacteroidales bacterium]|nr:tRNA epoxyqueuosine(34) reductase QueG [Bacteroidales bacterium]